MQNSVGWLKRIAATVRALFAGAKTPVVVKPSPSALEAGAAVATTLPLEVIVAVPLAAAPRMLSAQIACQAKLNVPVGKKPRVAKFVQPRAVARRPKIAKTPKKKATAPRSVYLPARHLAAKATPKTRSNVVTLPVAAKPVRLVARAAVVKPLRIAA